MFNSFRTDRCLVCHDRSSGIHFGVSTCEACKAFFRRTNLSSYSIAPPCSPIPCEINIKNRNNCPSCRYDKCKRLGMDRDNVIYGKPSKQQLNSIYQQDSFIEHLNKFSTEINQQFQLIRSLDDKQQIDIVGQMILQFFYPQTSTNHFEIIHRIFYLIFHSRKLSLLLNNHVNLQTILSFWLFVFYYETFLFKQSIPHEKLMILIQFLDIELKNISFFYGEHPSNRIDFLNCFTQLTNFFYE